MVAVFSVIIITSLFLGIIQRTAYNRNQVGLLEDVVDCVRRRCRRRGIELVRTLENIAAKIFGRVSFQQLIIVWSATITDSIARSQSRMYCI